MKNYFLVNRRPCLLEESGDPFSIPDPPEWRPLTGGDSSYYHSVTSTPKPFLFSWWSIVVCSVGIIIGLLAIINGLLQVFLG